MNPNCRTKIWLGLGAFVLAGQAPALAETPHHPGLSAEAVADTADLLQLVQGGEAGGEGGDGGEAGEGGEGGEAGGAGDAVTDDAAYLHQLALVRGHLDVGVDLYRHGEAEAARTHMKHPGDELYAGLEPAFAARGAAGFAEPLDRLASLVEAGAPAEEVEAAHAALLGAVAEAEAAALAAAEVPVVLDVVHRLVRTAAEEYDAAVEDGRVANAHEYQDALGFVRTAQGLIAGLDETRRGAAPEEVAAIEAELAELASAWPAVVAPETVAVEPSALYGAAARIEIEAQAAR